MEYQAKNGILYVLRNWMNNKEFSLMAEAQIILLKVGGDLYGWDQEKMKGMKELDMMKKLLSDNLLQKIKSLRAQAAESIILTPKFDSFDELPRDLILTAEEHIEKLFVESQPAIEPEESPKKK